MIEGTIVANRKLQILAGHSEGGSLYPEFVVDLVTHFEGKTEEAGGTSGDANYLGNLWLGLRLASNNRMVSIY